MRPLCYLALLASSSGISIVQRRVGNAVHIAVYDHDLAINATLSRHSALFHPSYREISIVGDEHVVTRDRPRDSHYRGAVSGAVDGRSATGRATATFVGDRLSTLVARAPGVPTVEVAWQNGRYVRVAVAGDGVFGEPFLATTGDGPSGGDGVEWEADGLRRNLRTGECRSGPTKYVSIVAFNDAARYARLGQDVEANTAAVFDLVHSIYTDGAPYGLYDGDVMTCRVAPVLAGQITWRDGNPNGVDYVAGAACQRANCAREACSSDEVSSSCLLESFTAYVRDHRKKLETALGVAIDNAQLLTARNLGGATIGLAWTGGMCNQLGQSAAVDQSSFPSSAFLATIVAHELGHNLGMPHDAGGRNLMAPSASTGEPSGVEMQFSRESKRSAAKFLETAYGRGWTAACLEDVVEEVPWDNPNCGDGVVDAGEDCDPGIGEDECCTARCRLRPGCECAVADACCSEEGLFLPSGTTCRPARDATCDSEERCTGASGNCPTDFYAEPGTECVDLSLDGTEVEGMCYRGTCVSPEDNCEGLFRFGEAATVVCPSLSSCAAIACKPREEERFCVVSTLPAADGTPCGPGKQCFSQTIDAGDGGVEGDSDARCIDSTELYLYHWDLGPDGCGENAVCVDQEGLAVTRDLCDDGTGRGPPPPPPRCGDDDAGSELDDDYRGGGGGGGNGGGGGGNIGAGGGGGDDDDDAAARQLFAVWIGVAVALVVLSIALCFAPQCVSSCKGRKRGGVWAEVVEAPPRHPGSRGFEPEENRSAASRFSRAQTAPVVARPVGPDTVRHVQSYPDPSYDERAAREAERAEYERRALEAAARASLASDAERQAVLARRREAARRKESEELERAVAASLGPPPGDARRRPALERRPSAPSYDDPPPPPPPLGRNPFRSSATSDEVSPMHGRYDSGPRGRYDSGSRGAGGGRYDSGPHGAGSDGGAGGDGGENPFRAPPPYPVRGAYPSADDHGDAYAAAPPPNPYRDPYADREREDYEDALARSRGEPPRRGRSAEPVGTEEWHRQQLARELDL